MSQTPFLPSSSATDPGAVEPAQAAPTLPRWRSFPSRIRRYWIGLALVTFVIGLGGGYRLGRVNPTPSHPGEAVGETTAHEMGAVLEQINPAEGYLIPAKFGQAGPKLLAAGAIHYDQFLGVYARAGQPLTQEQTAILTEGSEAQVVMNKENAYFLLNFFWALGLANRNPILTEGPLMAGGKEKAGSFASTAGWTIGQKPPMELYASTPILPLNRAQQKRLEEVASAVYRPCCNNPTHAPDCNHGMAMLGLLELMAAQDASAEAMFEAAKYVNAFWYPQQTLEIATLFKTSNGLEFRQVDARKLVGREYSSGSGFQAVHQWLASQGLLEQAPDSGGGCGV